jgi:hypothetical protein
MSHTTIWKFALPIADTSYVPLHVNAEVLSVAAQNGSVWIWARVDTTEPTGHRTFYVRGTGHPLGDAADARFVGTVHALGGALVWHVFEAT